MRYCQRYCGTALAVPCTGTQIPGGVHRALTPIYKTPRDSPSIIPIPRVCALLRPRRPLPRHSLRRVTIHHDIPIQGIHPRRSPSVTIRKQPLRRLHPHLPLLPRARSPDQISSLGQRMPRIHLKTSAKAASHCSTRSTQPEAHQQS